MRISSRLAILALVGTVLCFAPLKAQTYPEGKGMPQVHPQGQGMPTGAQDSPSRSQTWSGTLADADCKAATPTEKCEVSDLTRNFGLQTTAGKFMRLDSDGNEKVHTALQNARQKTGMINASVKGEMDGETLKVESVQIR
jgi:hypothetical protein